MLTHLHLQRFKCFRDLRIEPLGRVNLITGKNNTGKTSLLEALMIWDFPIHPYPAIELRGVKWPRDRGPGYALDQYLSFFLNRDYREPFVINEVEYALEDVSEPMIQDLLRGNASLITNYPKWKVNPAREERRLFTSVSSSLETDEVINRWWSAVALTPNEDVVLEFLHLIEPRIKRISMLDRLEVKQLYVQLEGESYPTSLVRFGEGIKRLVCLMLALINAQGGMLLVDEIDNGLHHSVQTQVWEYLFRYAKKLNVQLFATTHSADCVEAFAAVGSQPAYHDQGRLIRLYRKDDEIGEVSFDVETVQAAVEGNIEMRG